MNVFMESGIKNKDSVRSNYLERACKCSKWDRKQKKPSNFQQNDKSFGHDLSKIKVHSDKEMAKASGGPANDYEDCPVDWKKKAESALATGRPWISNVITGLVNLPSPIPAPVATLLNRHFHTTNRDDIKEIIEHYNDIYSAINSSIDFECETSCDDNVAAYVYRVWTDLHLCPIWYSLSDRKKANIIIHELAHDAAGRDDEAYIWEAKYNTLSSEDAIDNADSYSNFADEAS